MVIITCNLPFEMHGHSIQGMVIFIYQLQRTKHTDQAKWISRPFPAVVVPPPFSSNHTEMRVFPGILGAAPSSSLSPRLWISTKPRRPQHRHLCVASGDASDGVGLSVSDGELESRGFLVRRTATGLNVEALNEVFARVGFPRRDPSRIRRALEHAVGAVVWMEEARSKVEGRPVAFARATGDGVFNAVVWDVVVEPSFQGIGLGRAVMERLVADLRCMGVSNIALYAEPRVVGFYRPLGFAADPDGIRGMVYSRKNQQKKRR